MTHTHEHAHEDEHEHGHGPGFGSGYGRRSGHGHGHHRGRHRGHGGPWFEGRREPGFGWDPEFAIRKLRRFPGREEWIRRLEEFQKDLEERVADVADMIRRLKESGSDEPGKPGEPTATANESV